MDTMSSLALSFHFMSGKLVKIISVRQRYIVQPTRMLSVTSQFDVEINRCRLRCCQCSISRNAVQFMHSV